MNSALGSLTLRCWDKRRRKRSIDALPGNNRFHSSQMLAESLLGNLMPSSKSKCIVKTLSSRITSFSFPSQPCVVGRSIQPFISSIQSLNLIQPSCRQCFQSSSQLVRLATIGTSIPSGVGAVRVQMFKCSALRSNRPSIQFSSSRLELINTIFLVQSSYSSARGMLRRMFISRLIRLRRAI